MIDAKIIYALRSATGAGILDSKKAIEETNGDLEKAAELLRKKGISSAAKREDRTTSEGWVGSYVHATGKLGALVSLACETDFVARTDEFKNFAKDLAMHVVAFHPLYIRPEDIPEDVIAAERKIEEARAKKEGKPDVIAQKVVDGRIAKFQNESSLLKQHFLKDNSKSVEEIIAEKSGQWGEKIEVKAMARMSL